MRQAFLDVPRDLVEAGIIDGCSWWQLILHVYLPSAVPSLVAFGLSSATWHWNEFIWPLVITNSDKSRSLTAGLVRFTQLGEIGAQWSLLSAATLMVIAPLFITFLIFQRRFIQIFLHSGLKLVLEKNFFAVAIPGVMFLVGVIINSGEIQHSSGLKPFPDF